MNKRTDEPSLAQQRRDFRDQRAAADHARVIAAHTRRTLETGAKLFPNDTGLADRTRAVVEAWCTAYPNPGATKVQASTHEAGHFVAAGRLGLAPACAVIRHLSHGSKGYSGECIATARPVAPEARGAYTADDVEREAVFALAGPLSEWWTAGGDPYASPSEFLEGCMLAAHLADMQGEDRTAILDRVFTLTMQIVVTFQGQIEQVAWALKDKRRVNSSTSGVAKALNSIGGYSPGDLLPLTPEQDVALGKMMLNAPVDLARYTSEVGL